MCKLYAIQLYVFFKTINRANNNFFKFGMHFYEFDNFLANDFIDFWCRDRAGIKLFL